MALISCRECGKDVSSEAKFCPHCGIEIKRGRKAKKVIIIGGLVLLGIFFAALLTGKSNERNARLAAQATSFNVIAAKIVDRNLQSECGLHAAFAQHFAEMRDLGVSLNYVTESIKDDKGGTLKAFAAAIYDKSTPPDTEFEETYQECVGQKG